MRAGTFRQFTNGMMFEPHENQPVRSFVEGPGADLYEDGGHVWFVRTVIGKGGKPDFFAVCVVSGGGLYFSGETAAHHAARLLKLNPRPVEKKAEPEGPRAA